MKEPIYLYHGSPYLFSKIEPQKACGQNEKESLLAIYACEILDWVIPFALPIRWYPDNPSGKRAFECDEGKTIIIYGSLNPTGIGYIYKFKADGFHKIDEWQWVSNHIITPEEVIEIKVSDYWDTIVFSEEAKKINNELYGIQNKYNFEYI